MRVVFIGENFYMESGTAMSSMYEKLPGGSYKRTGWGFIRVALQKGDDVHIVPATQRETDHFTRILYELKKDN